MKRLYLIRHAKSSWSDPYLNDHDRPLNKRGKNDAPFMGSRLANYQPAPELIRSSTAKRARKTARAIARQIGYAKKAIVLDGDLYTFDMHGIIAVLRKTDEALTSLALVGHNYGITECAEYLTGRYLGNVPTCGIVAIGFEPSKKWADIGENDGRLITFDYPKQHLDRGQGA